MLEKLAELIKEDVYKRQIPETIMTRQSVQLSVREMPLEQSFYMRKMMRQKWEKPKASLLLQQRDF